MTNTVRKATPLVAIPIVLWEFSLGVYLVVKGFKLSPIIVGKGL